MPDGPLGKMFCPLLVRLILSPHIVLPQVRKKPKSCSRLWLPSPWPGDDCHLLPSAKKIIKTNFIHYFPCFINYPVLVLNPFWGGFEVFFNKEINSVSHASPCEKHAKWDAAVSPASSMVLPRAWGWVRGPPQPPCPGLSPRQGQAHPGQRWGFGITEKWALKAGWWPLI